MNEKQIEKLAELGNEWIKGDMHRIYLENLAGWYGLKTTDYNSGNIASATLAARENAKKGGWETGRKRGPRKPKGNDAH